MTKPRRTGEEVRREGWEALTQALGLADAVRFLQQFGVGKGDYTAERRRLLGSPTVDELLKEIKAHRPRARRRA